MSNLMRNKIVAQDIQTIVASDAVDWEKFRGKTVAVTGATGLIGKLCVETFLCADEKYQLGLKVVAFVRNLSRAKEILGNGIEGKLTFENTDILEPVSENIFADFLIHGAGVTASKMMVEQPVETIVTTLKGTRNMLEFASRCKMEGMVFLSSMEAYGTIKTGDGEIREQDLGYINPLEVRSSYSEGKRMAECLCAAYAAEYGVNVKIGRLAQTFGAGIAENENRVFAQFARSILREENIVLHTKGEKANCYCYTSDAIIGLLILLTRGEKGQAYNIANMDTFCSIKEMAETFLRVSKNKTLKLVFDIPDDNSLYGYAPSCIMRLNSEKLMELGWKPERNMDDMVERLMRSMESNELE